MTWEEPLRAVFFVALSLHESYFVSQGITDPLSLGLVVPSMVLGLSLVGVALVISMFRFEVGPAGIRNVDFWYRNSDWAWDEMESVRVISFLGMRYARIRTTGSKKALWLPLFVHLHERLGDTIHLHAPEAHPMRDLARQFSQSA